MTVLPRGHKLRKSIPQRACARYIIRVCNRLTQPLDKGIFGPVIISWREACHRYLHWQRARGISSFLWKWKQFCKPTIPTLVGHVPSRWSRISFASIVQTSFERKHSWAVPRLSWNSTPRLLTVALQEYWQVLRICKELKRNKRKKRRKELRKSEQRSEKLRNSKNCASNSNVRQIHGRKQSVEW